MQDDWAHEQAWFHAIDLGGGLVTAGRFGRDVPPNYTLYGAFELLRGLELKAARCFDVGTMDGLCAFVLKALGAREVVACDLRARPTFEMARARLGLDLAYQTPIDVLELPQAVGAQKADLVVLAGVLYHVPEPLAVLIACRKAIRPMGYLLLETAYLFDEAAPVMAFNPADRTRRQMRYANVFWRPSKRALWGMLRLAGFEVIATRAVDARITVLAQAKRPRQIKARERMIAAIQDHYRDSHYLAGIDFDALAADRSPAADIAYSGPTDDRFLCRATFEARVPYQPRWQPSSKLVVVRELARSRAIQARTAIADANARLLDELASRRAQWQRQQRLAEQGRRGER